MNEALYRAGHESALLEALGRTPELRLIDFFLDNPLFDFTRREIAEALGMSKRTLYRVLPGLLEIGVVGVSRRIGRAKLYRLNGGSSIVERLRGLERDLSSPPEAPLEEPAEPWVEVERRKISSAT
jgi:DNA-binding transcriptional ArsR family regulator